MTLHDLKNMYAWSFQYCLTTERKLQSRSTSLKIRPLWTRPFSSGQVDTEISISVFLSFFLPLIHLSLFRVAMSCFCFSLKLFVSLSLYLLFYFISSSRVLIWFSLSLSLSSVYLSFFLLNSLWNTSLFSKCPVSCLSCLLVKEGL